MNVIFFSPLGRSGSMLLHSLFDMHEEIVVMPWIYDEYDFNVNLNRTNEAIIDEFMQKFHQIFDNYNILRAGSSAKMYFRDKNEVEFTKIDQNLYKQNFLALCEHNQISTQKTLFELVNLAYAKTLGQDISKIKYIFVHIHCLDVFNYSKNSTQDLRYQFFAKNYPNMKALLSIRDLRKALYSYYEKEKTYVSDNNFITYKRSIFSMTMLHSLSAAMMYEISTCHDTLFADLDRLHQTSKDAMRKIADFLGIKFTQTLCESTFLGQPYYGNATSGIKIQGLDINANRGGIA